MTDEIPVQGMLTRKELAALTETGEIDTVLVAMPDMYGRLIGKRYDADYFLASAEHGMHLCNYLLACDMEMDTVSGYEHASWEQGYGDDLALMDWSTLRRASWLEKSALIMADMVNEETGQLIEVAPRSILKRQIHRATEMGLLVNGASEIEFFIFKDDYDLARAKDYRGLETSGYYREDYHLLQGSKVEPLIGAMRRHLKQSGIPVEFSKGEWSAGQHEINLRYTDALAMSDRVAIYKQLAKDIAHAQGAAITFMAKWDQELAGNSQHIHLSLWDTQSNRNVFYNPDDPQEYSKTFYHFLGGLLAHTREIMLFLAPNINSYKRYQLESFAPTGIAWSRDNRTAGFRIVGHGSSLRIECRIPGADANPYLTFAGLLAAGLDGIANQIKAPPAFIGDVYAAREIQHVPRFLRESIAEFRNSQFLQEAFGDTVMAHYLNYAEIEQRKFDEAVTDWERLRYFERI